MTSLLSNLLPARLGNSLENWVSEASKDIGKAANTLSMGALLAGLVIAILYFSVASLFFMMNKKVDRSELGGWGVSNQPSSAGSTTMAVLLVILGAILVTLAIVQYVAVNRNVQKLQQRISDFPLLRSLQSPVATAE